MKKLFILLSLCLVVGSARAKVTLPAIFTDNMVLEQKTQVTLYGKAAAGKKMTVTTGWDHEQYRFHSDAEGNWSVRIPTPEAGGPFDITISDGKKITLRNILIGEVWFCSGQSNMEMPVAGWGKVLNYEQEVAAADYPCIRLFQVKKATSLAPAADVASTMGGWQECSPASVPEFSALGYFFARRLWQELGIPVGVIDCTWGGTPAEAWTSYSTLKNVYGYVDEMRDLSRMNFDAAKMQERYISKMDNWRAGLLTDDRGYKDRRPYWCMPDYDDTRWEEMDLPGYWEGKGLKNFDGTVWFRRTVEIPAAWAGQDLTLSLAMIDDEDILYWNGEEAARGSGFTTPRLYTIPAKMVKPGKAVITVRVSDYGGEGGIHGKAEDMYLSSAQDKIPLAGKWKYDIGLSLAKYPIAPVSPVGSSSYPTVLYNAMVHPLVTFPVKGVIWYQGEANVGRAAEYTDLFQALIHDWRDKWNNPDMPFYFVQLANFMERVDGQEESPWPELREAQAKALCMEHTGMAVIYDIGEAGDIHPKNKQEVGRRLSLIALADTYGKDLTCSGPRYATYRVDGDRVEVEFSCTGGGLQAKGGELKGFVISGPDHRFHKAYAVISGNKVILSSPEVKYPVAVRYGWGNNIESTLYNAEGLPASPFRTDNW